MPGSSSRIASEDEQKLAFLVQQLRAKLKENEKVAIRAHIEEDDFLAMFLRVKGYDFDKAHQAVLKYYSHFEAFQDPLLGIQSSAHYKHLYDANVFVVLRQRCSQGTTVCVYRNEVWDPTKGSACGLVPVRQSALFMLQELIRDPAVQLGCASFVLDFAGFSYAQFRQVKPADVRFLVQMWQDGFPLRVAGVHLVNYPTILLGLYYVACRFLKEKLRKRVHFHKDMESLQENLGIGKHAMPERLGGAKDMDDVVDRSIEQRLVKDDVKYADYYA